jgi:hypothetical protein
MELVGLPPLKTVNPNIGDMNKYTSKSEQYAKVHPAERWDPQSVMWQIVAEDRRLPTSLFDLFVPTLSAPEFADIPNSIEVVGVVNAGDVLPAEMGPNSHAPTFTVGFEKERFFMRLWGLEIIDDTATAGRAYSGSSLRYQIRTAAFKKHGTLQRAAILAIGGLQREQKMRNDMDGIGGYIHAMNGAFRAVHDPLAFGAEVSRMMNNGRGRPWMLAVPNHVASMFDTIVFFGAAPVRLSEIMFPNQPAGITDDTVMRLGNLYVCTMPTFPRVARGNGTDAREIQLLSRIRTTLSEFSLGQAYPSPGGSSRSLIGLFGAAAGGRVVFHAAADLLSRTPLFDNPPPCSATNASAFSSDEYGMPPAEASTLHVWDEAIRGPRQIYAFGEQYPYALTRDDIAIAASSFASKLPNAAEMSVLLGQVLGLLGGATASPAAVDRMLTNNRWDAGAEVSNGVTNTIRDVADTPAGQQYGFQPHEQLVGTGVSGTTNASGTADELPLGVLSFAGLVNILASRNAPNELIELVSRLLPMLQAAEKAIEPLLDVSITTPAGTPLFPEPMLGARMFDLLAGTGAPMFVALPLNGGAAGVAPAGAAADPTLYAYVDMSGAPIDVGAPVAPATVRALDLLNAAREGAGGVRRLWAVGASMPVATPAGAVNVRVDALYAALASSPTFRLLRTMHQATAAAFLRLPAASRAAILQYVSEPANQQANVDALQHMIFHIARKAAAAQPAVVSPADAYRLVTGAGARANSAAEREETLRQFEAAKAAAPAVSQARRVSASMTDAMRDDFDSWFQQSTGGSFDGISSELTPADVAVASGLFALLNSAGVTQDAANAAVAALARGRPRAGTFGGTAVSTQERRWVRTTAILSPTQWAQVRAQTNVLAPGDPNTGFTTPRLPGDAGRAETPYPTLRVGAAVPDNVGRLGAYALATADALHADAEMPDALPTGLPLTATGAAVFAGVRQRIPASSPDATAQYLAFRTMSHPNFRTNALAAAALPSNALQAMALVLLGMRHTSEALRIADMLDVWMPMTVMVLRTCSHIPTAPVVLAQQGAAGFVSAVREGQSPDHRTELQYNRMEVASGGALIDREGVFTFSMAVPVDVLPAGNGFRFARSATDVTIDDTVGRADLIAIPMPAALAAMMQQQQYVHLAGDASSDDTVRTSYPNAGIVAAHYGLDKIAAMIEQTRAVQLGTERMIAGHAAFELANLAYPYASRGAFYTRPTPTTTSMDPGVSPLGKFAFPGGGTKLASGNRLADADRAESIARLQWAVQPPLLVGA